MPGVPSGRGCDGCRKQKKKCDEAKPSCSRCARLHMVCVGSGLQRYKFMEQQGSLACSTKGQASKLSTTPRKVYPSPKLCSTPSNEYTILVYSFADTIGASTDLRYNLAWTYGVFLSLVPQRLGINRALDTSVQALISAHSHICLRRENITEALIKYSYALKVLRVCLDDPIQAHTPEVLCSVYLLLVCQAFLGTNGNRWSGHGEGAAQIIKARGFRKPRDDFENQLLLALRGAVLFEGLFNDKIRMSPWEWRALIENEFDGVSCEGQMMRCLARYPDLMQRGKSISKGEEGYLELLEELRAHYRTLKVILATLQDRLVVIEGHIADGVERSATVVRIHSHYQRSYGMCLVICIISNCVLDAVDGEDTQLVSESVYFSKEILSLAESAATYRPVGASYVRLCLIAAWVGTADCSIKNMAKEAMEEYERDFACGQLRMSIGELERLHQQLRLLDPDPC